MQLHECELYQKGFSKFFEEHVSSHIRTLEARRQRYLKQLKLLSFIAFITILSLPFTEHYISMIFDYIGWLHHTLTSHKNGDYYVSQPEAYTWITYTAVPVFSILFASFPVFSYRRHTKKIIVNGTHITNLKFSIKEFVFTQLLQYFGKFTFKRTQGVSLSGMHGASILPEYDEYLTEDHITGVYHNTKIEISEAKFIRNYHGKRVAVFNGLILLLDVCNSDTMLRGPFNGKTVIIQDSRKNLSFTQNKFKDFEHLKLPTKALEDQFEVFSTDKGEATNLISEELFTSLLKLSSIVIHKNEQTTHLDDKIMFWLAQKTNFVGSFLLALFSLPFTAYNFVTGKGLYFTWNIEPFNPTKHTNIYKNNDSGDFSEIEAINHGVECNFFNDKVLITIPYEHDLFEPNSIFEPALVQEDIHLLFAMMNTIEEISKTIADSKFKK